MISRVTSGGQSGADLAGWKAAKSAGIACSGWMPRGFRTEDGPRPEYAELYGAKEHESAMYPPRTRANVADSDGTIWFGSIASTGFRVTHDAAIARLDGYPFLIVYLGVTTPREVAAWVREHKISVLNVAGNRGSSDRELEGRAERFLGRVFNLLREDRP